MENLGFGLQVTVLGLGIVFGLLVALWLLLTLAVRLETRDAAAPAGPEPPRVSIGPPDPPDPLDATASLDPALVAAISVAVVRHAELRRRQAAPAMRSHWPGSQLFASRWVAAGRMRQARTWPGRNR